MKVVEMYKEAKYVEVPESRIQEYIEKGFKRYEEEKVKKTPTRKPNTAE